MSTNRPITTSFPLGLFCTATLSAPQQNPPEDPSVASSEEQKISPLPDSALEPEGWTEYIYADDGSLRGCLESRRGRKP